jgi:hypothetical protein
MPGDRRLYDGHRGGERLVAIAAALVECVTAAPIDELASPLSIGRPSLRGAVIVRLARSR